MSASSSSDVSMDLAFTQASKLLDDMVIELTDRNSDGSSTGSSMDMSDLPEFKQATQLINSMTTQSTLRFLSSASDSSNSSTLPQHVYQAMQSIPDDLVSSDTDFHQVTQWGKVVSQDNRTAEQALDVFMTNTAACLVEWDQSSADELSPQRVLAMKRMSNMAEDVSSGSEDKFVEPERERAGSIDPQASAVMRYAPYCQ
jgi:hypothetical protein